MTYYITIIQQGTQAKVVEANGTLRDTLSNEGIDVDEFLIARGGVPVDLDDPITADMTVTVTKRSVGA
jgi:uncharacterized protein YabE (DUF348 family)